MMDKGYRWRFVRIHKCIQNLIGGCLAVNKIIIAFLVLITVVPMVYILVASFMDPQALISKGISFDPKDWTIEGYQRVFSDKSIIRGFLNSFLTHFHLPSLLWQYPY